MLSTASGQSKIQNAKLELSIDGKPTWCLIQGSYPFSETIFQDSDFSRSPKCTIIEAINPYEIKIQK